DFHPDRDHGLATAAVPAPSPAPIISLDGGDEMEPDDPPVAAHVPTPVAPQAGPPPVSVSLAPKFPGLTPPAAAAAAPAPAQATPVPIMPPSYEDPGRDFEAIFTSSVTVTGGTVIEQVEGESKGQANKPGQQG
ncbi:MAG: hypothetical protein K2X91_19100, partial [Thermoleophilia bacterium]|nr:hypothetical protein [Thermoleophilia bacterium]